MFKDISLIVAGVAVLGTVVFWVSKNIKKTIQVMSSWGIYEAYNFSFDFLVWPLLQSLYGFAGIALLTVIALINNFIILIWYHRKKVDWFGVNVLEDIKAKGHIWVNKIGESKNTIKKISLYIPAKILQFLIWLLKKNDVFAFVTLSVWQDSFITTIFLRHGKFEKLDKRDYTIFVSSTILGCMAWSVVMEVLIIVVRFVWGLF